MTFRFEAKHGLLTYSALGNDMDAVEGLAHRIVEHLGVLGQCIVGRENHLDGGLHLHAFFMFERKFESRNVRIFDVDGKHPNIVRGYSNADAGCAYACKRATLSQEDLTRDNYELRWIDMVESGMKSSYRRLERSFSTLAGDWLQGHFCVPLPRLSVTPTGNTEIFPSRTAHLSTWNSNLKLWKACENGLSLLLTGIEEVSDLARRAFACTAPPPFGRSPGGGLVHC